MSAGAVGRGHLRVLLLVLLHVLLPLLLGSGTLLLGVAEGVVHLQEARSSHTRRTPISRRLHAPGLSTSSMLRNGQSIDQLGHRAPCCAADKEGGGR